MNSFIRTPRRGDYVLSWCSTPGTYHDFTVIGSKKNKNIPVSRSRATDGMDGIQEIERRGPAIHDDMTIHKAEPQDRADAKDSNRDT